MRHILTILALLSLAGFAGSRIPQDKPQEKPKEAAAPAEESKIPPEYANKPNPTKPTPAGLEEARRFYGYDCEMCHGKDGDGKGDVGEQMKLDMHDWRAYAALEKMTDGELFYIITKGKGKMAPEGDRVKEEVRWQLVNLVRSYAKKKDKDEVPKEAPKPPSGLR